MNKHKNKHKPKKSNHLVQNTLQWVVKGKTSVLEFLKPPAFGVNRAMRRKLVALERHEPERLRIKALEDAHEERKFARIRKIVQRENLRREMKKAGPITQLS